jgi:transposase
LEGEQNELASFGYNRDRKKGKQQIVVGLLCDEEGDPVSVQVFEGNTTDPKTFSDQVQKVTKRFNCSNVIMVGDRGMIKSAEIQTIHEHQLHYLTAVTKPSIQKLINDNILQHSLFDIKLVEIEDDKIRYLLRRNPIRAAEIMHVRKAKQARIEKAIENSNTYLKEHPGATTTTQFKKLNTLIKTLKVNKWITLTSTGRIITLAVNQEVLDDLSKLDGCYVLKTDVPKDCASADTLHARYKDLGFVEYAFRTMKTTELEIRPIHVRSASHTRGHVFVVMLAYKIIRHLETLWKEENVTVHEGLQALKEICATKVTTPHGGSCLKVPTPRALPKQLLSRLSISLPPTLPPKQFSVVTRKSLVKS